MKFSDLNKKRWKNFKANKRGYYSLIIFLFFFIFSLFSEFIANDQPILVKYKSGYYSPIIKSYPETTFGGMFETDADYRDEFIADEINNNGWMLWAPIPYSFDTINYDIDRAPSAPDRNHLLGTDDQTRDVIARIIYGFRISTIFGLIVVLFSSIIGIAAGAVMGYFGGWVDLILQRLVEIWDGMPMLYVIIIMAALFNINFPILVFLVILFSWTGLLGVVRAEFLRARNFEYVRAARAMGVSDIKIMFRHLLPNAMVATLTFLPFTITASIGTLTTLDFLGYGLPPSYPSLGELALQAKNNLQAPWLAFSAFITLAVMLSLLVFVFEGIRDAFDPRKTFK